MAIESNTLDNDTDQTAAGLYEYARGDLISVGGGIAVVLELKENQGFVKLSPSEKMESGTSRIG